MAGNKNGGNVKPDASDEDIGDALYEHNIRAPGIIEIPVCSAEEALRTGLTDGIIYKGVFPL